MVLYCFGQAVKLRILMTTQLMSTYYFSLYFLIWESPEISMCFHQPLFKLIKDESSCSGWRNFLGNVSGILSASLFGLSNSSRLFFLMTWGKSPKAWWWVSTEICVKWTFYCSGSKRGDLLLEILSYEPSGLLVGHQLWSWGLWVLTHLGCLIN